MANVGDVKLDQILQGIDNLAFDGKNLMVTIGNVIPGNHINARGYFTAMMIGFLASIIFCKVMKRTG